MLAGVASRLSVADSPCVRVADVLRTPRFDGLFPPSEASSEIKARVRRENTQPEMLLRRELWRRGYRYRVHGRQLVGKPDLVFTSLRVVIFCDGDFWHGRDWRERKDRLSGGTNAEYWIAKIESNIARDERVTAQLRSEGWHVIRIWESDIKKHPHRAATLIGRVLLRRKSLRR